MIAQPVSILIHNVLSRSKPAQTGLPGDLGHSFGSGNTTERSDYQNATFGISRTSGLLS